jgi:hypothetical protein
MPVGAIPGNMQVGGMSVAAPMGQTPFLHSPAPRLPTLPTPRLPPLPAPPLVNPPVPVAVSQPQAPEKSPNRTIRAAPLPNSSAGPSFSLLGARGTASAGVYVSPYGEPAPWQFPSQNPLPAPSGRGDGAPGPAPVPETHEAEASDPNPAITQAMDLSGAGPQGPSHRAGPDQPQGARSPQMPPPATRQNSSPAVAAARPIIPKPGPRTRSSSFGGAPIHPQSSPISPVPASLTSGDSVEATSGVSRLTRGFTLPEPPSVVITRSQSAEGNRSKRSQTSQPSFSMPRNNSADVSSSLTLVNRASTTIPHTAPPDPPVTRKRSRDSAALDDPPGSQVGQQVGSASGRRESAADLLKLFMKAEPASSRAASEKPTHPRVSPTSSERSSSGEPVPARRKRRRPN